MIPDAKLLIAGPCSAETEQQTIETAVQLAAIDKKIIYRAGIWKPRTKPGSFEGNGVKALPWMKQVKIKTGLETAVEVATAAHVYECLKHGIDWVWIGARTTVNPFSVQEIADALKGSDLKVMIKNPLNADVELWSGAVQRIQNAGIAQPLLIHRGFSTYVKTKLRNEPVWNVPLEMRRRFPELSMVCDPSHIAGNSSYVGEIAQQALDLDFGGLMVEVHPDPESAWSDASQQLEPVAFRDLLHTLQWKNEMAGNSSLDMYRKEISQLDDFLLALLGRRMKISDEIGLYKKQHAMTVLQTARWNEVFSTALERGKSQGLSEEFLMKYLDVLHIESIRRQQAQLYTSANVAVLSENGLPENILK